MTGLKLRPIIVAAACALACAPPAAGQQLPELVEAALDGNPRIEEARARVRAARARTGLAAARFRPQISATLSAGVSDRSAELGSGEDFEETASPTTAAVQLDHTLYEGGRRAVAARSASLEFLRAEQELAAVERDIVEATVLAYNEWISSRRRIRAERESLGLISVQLDAAAERLREGAGSRTELLQAQTRLAEAEARVASAAASEQSVTARLVALTGLETFVPPAQPALARPDIPASLADAIELALMDDPGLRSADIAERQAALGAIAAGRRYAPNLTLSARAQTVTDPSPLLDRDDELRATVTLAIPLYEGGARPAERAAALAERDAVRLAVLNLRAETQARVTAQWAALEAAQQSVRAQARRVEFAGDALQGVLEGRDVGLSSTLDILDAERERLAARLALVDAQTAEAEARTAIAASTMSFTALR